MRKILTSLLMITTVVTAVTLSSSAFFSDVETSEDNQFQAGSIDLLVGDQNNMINPAMTAEDPNLIAVGNWDLTDLTDEVFFDYQDIKPGDWGRDTIQLQVNDNSAYLCAAVTITRNGENGLTEPEEDAGDVTPGVGDPRMQFWGELGDYLQFVYWDDQDGDGYYESGDNIIVGPAAVTDMPSFAGLNPAVANPLPTDILTLADSGVSNLTAQGVLSGAPIEPGEIYNVSKFWCFGSIVEDSSTNTGFRCDVLPYDLSNVATHYNLAQTDRVRGALNFYAIQSRNNDTFDCQDDWTPPAPTVL